MSAPSSSVAKVSTTTSVDSDPGRRSQTRRPSLAWYASLALAVAIGTVLRLYDLPDQLLLDDEWHALHFVIGKSFLSVLTTHTHEANSIPQNLYAYLVLHTVGWSEMSLRLGSVASGLLALLVLPLAVSRLWGRLPATIFAYLLAVSPCVIFYSRLARPYAAVLLLGFVSFLALVAWSRTGDSRAMAAYTLSGFAAIYAHIYATFLVVVPLVCLAACRATGFVLPGLGREGAKDRELPPAHALGAAAVMALLGSFLMLPAYVQHPLWLGAFQNDRATTKTFIDFASLLSGTHVAALEFLFVVLAVAGLVALFRADAGIGIAATCAWAAYVLQAGLSAQAGAHVGIQVARYAIAFFPLAFLQVSLALASVIGQGGGWRPLRLARLVVAAAFLAVLVATGPLWQVYKRPNNFTNHSAFQYSYRPHDWSISPRRDFVPDHVMRQDLVPAFYRDSRTLRSPGLLEFPMLVGDHANFLYYYQVFHRRPVAIGYFPDVVFLLPDHSDATKLYSDLPIDFALTRVPLDMRPKIRFRNIVPLTDTRLLRERYRGWLVVVHKHPDLEYRGARRPTVHQVSGLLAERLRRSLGAPIEDTEDLWVWRIT